MVNKNEDNLNIDSVIFTCKMLADSYRLPHDLEPVASS